MRVDYSALTSSPPNLIMVSISLTSVLKILASLVPSVERRGWRAVEVHWRELTRLVSSDFRSVRVLGALGARLLNSYSILVKVFVSKKNKVEKPLVANRSVF